MHERGEGQQDCRGCKGKACNPVKLKQCGHVSCRYCLDTNSGKTCPTCQRPFNGEDYEYLDPRQGADFWEFSAITGFKGRGGATLYEVLWHTGERTWEPARNIPSRALRDFRESLRAQREATRRMIDEVLFGKWDFREFDESIFDLL